MSQCQHPKKSIEVSFVPSGMETKGRCFLFLTKCNLLHHLYLFISQIGLSIKHILLLLLSKFFSSYSSFFFFSFLTYSVISCCIWFPQQLQFQYDQQPPIVVVNYYLDLLYTTLSSEVHNDLSSTVHRSLPVMSDYRGTS